MALLIRALVKEECMNGTVEKVENKIPLTSWELPSAHGNLRRIACRFGEREIVGQESNACVLWISYLCIAKGLLKLLLLDRFTSRRDERFLRPNRPLPNTR